MVLKILLKIVFFTLGNSVKLMQELADDVKVTLETQTHLNQVSKSTCLLLYDVLSYLQTIEPFMNCISYHSNTNTHNTN